jgi:5-methyltetrahydropteroyltriglutamate--homocysteine methyltransferase
LTGIFPRSDELIQATRAFEKKKVDKAELKEHFANDTKKVIDLQVSHGLDTVNDGLLEWQDIFRPFSESLPGIKVGGVTRWFNNNTFYRIPIINDKLTSDGKILDKYVHTDMLRASKSKWSVTLPGPYTFTHMCQNRFYDSENELMHDFAQILAGEIKNLERLGPCYIALAEPALVYHPPKKGDLASVRNAVEKITTNSSMVTGIHTYFGDLSKVYPDILDFNVDSIGVDLYETPLEMFGEHDFTKYLACGCIDARNSSMENQDDLLAMAERIFENVKPERVSFGPNCDLEYLPRSVAEKKVGIISDFMKALKNKGGQ